MADDSIKKPIELSEHELLRYGRQIIMPDFGEDGQRQLKQAHVLIAGVGGLGSPVAIYLSTAGIGHLTIVDCDSVDVTNLNRQILHWEEDVNRRKVESAEQKLRKINSTIAVEAVDVKITGDNIAELLQGIDLVMDCMDNMETRFLINEACVKKGIPMIHGGVREMLGEVTTIIPGKTPCLECLLPRNLSKKETFPIFGATAAMIASLQVLEAIKLLSGTGRLLTDRMLFINGSDMEIMMIDLQKKPDCRICGGLR
ncbi:MAG: HesA/MoeB/ThiF family protein [Proteobacteria bacterium]|nr:HesA/MoeB/ThiF family protein [Pseudomonadota bacterium]